MAISLVQSVPWGRTSSDNPVVGLTSTLSGSLIVVIIQTNASGGGTPATGITDNQGNTYLHQSGFTVVNGLERSDIWYSENSTSGVTSVNISVSASGGQISGFVQEYSGVKLSGALDTFGTSTGNAPSGGQVIGPNLTASQNGSLFITCSGISTATLHAYASVNSPWSLTSNYLTGLASLIQSTAGAAQATITLNVGEGGNYAAVGIIFQPQVGVTLNLSLSDSVSSNDSTANNTSKTLLDTLSCSDFLLVGNSFLVSDNILVNDAFSLNSSFIAPTVTPSVETLTNSVIPSEVKTFWKFQE